MEQPESLAYPAHPWQLKGASQAHALCFGPFKGIIVADEMGLGKTLLAILAMYLAKDEVGCFSVVVCPAATVTNWEMEI